MSKTLKDNKNYILLVGSFLVVLFLYGIIVSVFYRAPYSDELLYLNETKAIFDLLKNGHWIGNYPVAVHGFLFKIPPALIYFLTGPSIVVATMWNICIALASIYIMFKIIYDLLSLEIRYCVYSILLLAGTAQFVIYFSTYYRDITALFSLLLSIYFILKRKKIMLGVALMLLLDGKEHIFFTSIFAVIVNEFVCYKKSIPAVLLNLLKILIFPLLYVVLTNFTKFLPLNIYIPFLFRFTEKANLTIGISRLTNNVQITNAGINEVIKIKEIFQFTDTNFILKGLNVLLKLIGKVLYPRTFGFLSMPLIISIPAGIQAVRILRRKERKKYIFALLFIFNIVFYLVAYSHGRYLFPIFPVISLLYVFYLMEIENTKIFIPITIIIISIVSLYFEYTQIKIKIILSILLNIFYILPFIFRKHQNAFLWGHILITSGILASVGFAYMFSPSQNGQIYIASNYGSQYSVSKLVKEYDFKNKYIAVSDYKIGRILGFYIGEPALCYGFNHFTLKKQHPRYNKIQEYGKNSVTYNKEEIMSLMPDVYIEVRYKNLHVNKLEIPETYKYKEDYDFKNISYRIYEKDY